MGSNAVRLILSRSSSSPPGIRWMCTSTSPGSSGKQLKDGLILYRKLRALAFGGTKDKVADALVEWVKQGHSTNKNQLVGYVYQLRKYKKYDHAIQLYEWMDKSRYKLNNRDAAIRIDLLAKTVGIAAAEEYFNRLEKMAQTNKTYGALLSCYRREKMLEKAEELFQKMKELNFHSSALNYNNMMNLHLNSGQPDKVASLFQEMEKQNILPNSHTYNYLFNSYVATKDLEAVERALELLKTKNVVLNWLTYGNLATIYVNAGLIEKANAALEKIEEEKKTLKDCEAFHTLLKLYGMTCNKSGVDRAWQSLKLVLPKPMNLSYLMLMLALSRLGDVEAMEKYFREWESASTYYDIRIPNALIKAYLNRDMITEAISLYDSVSKRGIEPRMTTENLFMKFYLKKREVDLAMRYLEAGASKVHPEERFPDAESVNAFVTYFEEEKDSGTATRFSNILKKIDGLDSETEKRLNNISG